MPIVHFHLAEGQADAEQQRALLLRASEHYAQVLSAPMDRVRVFLHLYDARRVAVAGGVVAETGQHAPYYEFLVLDGRPREQIQQLQQGFTDLLVEVLGVARERIRGRCHRVPPEDWSIAGRPASEQRAGEIRARVEAAQSGQT